VADRAELADFYEAGYGGEAARAERGARWRALGARGKADHVLALCVRAGVYPQSTLDVGCGDGALLCELHRRGFGGRLAGVEIAQAAVEIANAREEIARVELYDGRHLPAGDGEYQLGILSHVLEHVREPATLLAEAARVCGAVVVEVPLEDNLSARRASKRAHATEVGHLHRLSRAAARAIVRDAGLRVAGELEDALPLEVHRFLAADCTVDGQSPAAQGKRQLGARAKWAVRTGLHSVAPPAARALFTVHYACLCLPVEDPANSASKPSDPSRPRRGPFQIPSPRAGQRPRGPREQQR
jgi:SAM-dependent methyltransferase